jgi:hypothetical protein
LEKSVVNKKKEKLRCTPVKILSRPLVEEGKRGKGNKRGLRWRVL